MQTAGASMAKPTSGTSSQPLQSPRDRAMVRRKDLPPLLDMVTKCGTRKDLLHLRRMHAAMSPSILQEVCVSNALIRAYGRCGAGGLMEARNLFDRLPRRTVVSWNALIAGYVDHGWYAQALECFRQMEVEAEEQGTISPSEHTYVSVLKACAHLGSHEIGEEIHGKAKDRGLLNNNVVLGTALIDMYAKCGLIQKAHKVLDALPLRTVVSWSALISGYANQGLGHEAVRCYRQMLDEGVSPNVVTYVCVLKACSAIGSLEIGEGIHAKVREEGLLKSNAQLGTALVDMYAKCGALQIAHSVFEELPNHDVVAWSVLIAGYVEHGLNDQAFKIFKRMEAERIAPDAVTFACILKACATVRSLEIGEEIHAKVRKQSLLKKSIVVGNALIDMYAKCGALQRAHEVFDELPQRDVASWTILIAGYANNGLGHEAVHLLKQMEDEKISPNAWTYSCVLNACVIVGSFEIGVAIHDKIREQGLLKDSIVLGNALINMYSKFGAVQKAEQVFSELPHQDVVSWNVLIAGYIENGLSDQAIKRFKQMDVEGVLSDAITYACILNACAATVSLEIGKEVHARLIKEGLLEKNIVLGTALINMYVKCSAFERACEVFDELPNRDPVSWNALLDGYIENGRGDEAVKCFKKMEVEGVFPDELTYVSTLKACAGIGSLEVGDEILSKVMEQPNLQRNIAVATALIDMFAKCGALQKARKVFDGLPQRDVVSWNVLIAGYAQFGQVHMVFHAFKRMRSEGIEPNLLTFLALLNACSHAALLNQGEKLFYEMIVLYNITPIVEHYTCMVDLFGRAGVFNKANQFLIDDVSTLLAFLSACQKWGKVELGSLAFEKIMQLDEMCAAAYVCMANICASASMHRDAHKTRSLEVKNRSSLVYVGA